MAPSRAPHGSRMIASRVLVAVAALSTNLEVGVRGAPLPPLTGGWERRPLKVRFFRVVELSLESC